MREKELRLALICYGGVSLAVYMHGITKEIWHLVRASRDNHDGSSPSSGSEAAYRELLEVIEQETDIRLRIFSDIITGASAGGINGIYLGHAIVTGQSLEPLTDMWLDNADVTTLLDPDAKPISKFSKFWAAPIAWGILRRKDGGIDRTVGDEAKDEVAEKLSQFVRARWFQPPFGGRIFSELLLNAFHSMQASGDSRPLLPSGQPLDLFVTVTDFAGHEQVLRLNSPKKVTESEHRLAIGFSTRGQPAGQLAEVPELVFAGRATASFPGAFPAFSVRELDGLLLAKKFEWKNRSTFLQRILPQQFAAGKAEDTMLIDGSVLANAPFAQAISALRNRPARREVDRRFVYIDPKPGRPSFKPDFAGDDEEGSAGQKRPPGFFATIFGATSDIPREQPIRDSLEHIQGRSERIERMREVTEALRVEVERSVEAMLGNTWFLSKPTPQRLEKWRSISNQKGADAAGFSYPAYGHLKLVGIVDDMIAIAKRAAPDVDADHFVQLRNKIWAELRARGLANMAGLKGIGATENSIRFFREQDVRYRIRRLRFLARRLVDDIETNRGVQAQGVAEMRKAVYASLGLFLDRETSEFLGEELAEAVREGVNDPSRFIDLMAQKRDLVLVDQTTDTLLCDAMLALPEDNRRQMLLAYLGYSLYDIATLPLLQGEGLDEFDPVKVDRISPDDAQTIRKGDASKTLKGIEFNNFGAFFSRSYRENDFLWGRLHGVDRLIDIVLSSTPAALQDNPGAVMRIKQKAFNAVLDQEEKRLTKIGKLIAELRHEISEIAI